MAPTKKECELLVLGIGSGGLACARRASSMYGVKAIAIEVKRLGGTCVNVGCVPKKITWNAAAIKETIHESKAYGFNVEEKSEFDWAAFKGKRDAFVKKLNGIYERNLVNDKVEYLAGFASFIDQHTVHVKLNDGTEVDVVGKKILIAVGGYPTLPPVKGAEHGITSDGFFELPKQPKKVAVVGAGYIAVEMAGMFNALGTETHLLIRQDRVLRTFDPMVQDRITELYKKQGIHIHTQCSQSLLEDLGNGQKKLHIKDSDGESTLEVDTVLWAIGRSAEMRQLNVAATGVKLNQKDHVIVDDFQNTNIPHIYSLGDACDRGFELTPVAIAAGRKLADRLFGGISDSKLEYENIPSVVFSHPTVGSVGMPEPAARKKFGDENVKVYTSTFNDLWYAPMEQDDKVQTMHKIVVAGKEERVVGVHIVGRASDEVMQGFGVAVRMGATKKDFDRCVAIHPTAGEELVTMR